MENIIIKAIEGGYDPISKIQVSGYGDVLKKFKGIYTANFDEKDFLGIGDDLARKIILDSLFWKSLGKACKWGYEKGKYEVYKPPNILRTIDENNGKKTFLYDGWLNRAFNFHEINLTVGWSAAVKYLEEEINKP